MRLFLAVDLDDRVRQAAVAEGAAIARRVTKGPASPRIGWVRAENLHLTLRFLGEVGDPVAAGLVQTFGGELRTPAFSASLSRWGAFPETGSPRVLWIGVDEGASPLKMLYEEVEERLGALGFAPEDRPFSAHLTMGRVRDARGRGSARIRQAIQRDLRAPARWRVDHVTLYQSRLSPKGPTYVALARAELARRA